MKNQKQKLMCHEEKELIRRLNAKGYSSGEISEHLDIRGFTRRPAVIRRWLSKQGLESGYDPDKRALKVVERKVNFLTYDIETTNFKGNRGEILCFGYKWNDEPTQVLKTYSYKGWGKLNIEDKDKFLVAEIRDIIIKADVMAGHYAQRFDHRFIQTRCMHHNIGPIPKTKHVDTWKIAKDNLACSSNRLGTLAEAFNKDHQKDSVEWKYWRRSHAYDKESIDILAEYCKKDVDSTYELCKRFLPIADCIPNLNLMTGSPIFQCPACGSEKVIRMGKKHTKVQTYHRFQCQGCGRFSRGRKSIADPNQERHMW